MPPDAGQLSAGVSQGWPRFMLGVWYQTTGPGAAMLERLLLLEVPRCALLALAAGATIGAVGCGRASGHR